MEKEKSIKINFVMNMILNVSSIIYPLVTFPYVSRVLGTAGTGKISFATSFTAYFTTFASLGIPTYGIKIIAQKRDNKEECSHAAHELLIINFIATAIAYFVFIFLLFNMPKLQEDKILYIISALSIGLNALGMEWLYKGFECYAYITKRTILFKFIALIGMFLLVRSQEDYRIYAFLTVLGTSGSFVLNMVASRKYINYKYLGPYNIYQHLKPILYLVCASLVTSLYAHMDSTMIGLILGDDSNGLYYSTVRIKSMLIMISSALTTVLIPRMSYYFAIGDWEKIKVYTAKAINAVSLISLPLLSYSVIMAPECLVFFAGSDYIGAANTLRIQLVACGLVGYSSIWGNQILVPAGNEKDYFKCVSIGAVVNLGLNAILIPTIGIEGAAIATMFTEGTVCIALYKYCRKYIGNALNIRTLCTYIISCIPSIGAVVLMKKYIQIASVFAELCITTVTFFGVFSGIMLWIIRDDLFMETVHGIIGKLVKRK